MENSSTNLSYQIKGLFYRKWSEYYNRRIEIHDSLSYSYNKWKRFSFTMLIRLFLYNLSESIIVLWLMGVIK